jgi:hypothetical protein
MPQIDLRASNKTADKILLKFDIEDLHQIVWLTPNYSHADQ